MKHRIFSFLLVIFLFSFFSCTSSKINSNENDIIGTWYPKKPDGNVRVLINQKSFIPQRMPYSQDTEVTENTPQDIKEKIGKWETKDTIKVIEKSFVKNDEGKDAILLVMERQRDGKAQYNSFLFSTTEVKGMKTVFTPKQKGFETIEEAKKAMQEAKFQNINQEILFSGEYKKNTLPKLKPMLEITKEDYIAAIKYVRSFESELKEYAIEKTNNDSEYIGYELRKVAQKLADKKLFLLGYNPNDLPADGSNYLDKFKGDKEIEELNNTKSEFRF
ncbi:hypothetical protein WAF17_07255 [Bernardetia sp. ABR2-2B]|uniref:hypothetical protein n=1 Tax=Bernardetia sp. ABR2-2B TaxID=3127472 RepID=UPI0030CEB0A2